MNRSIVLYRAVLRLLPVAFRQRYQAEMVEIASDRVAREGLPGLLAESASVLVTAGRLRWRAPQLQWATAALLLLALVSVRGGARVPGDMDVTATDPAGEFTLVVRAGRAVGGSIDRQPLAPEQLIHAGDSIRVLAPSGAVLFAIAYDADNARIAWAPRPAHCRGRALHCGVEQ